MKRNFAKLEGKNVYIILDVNRNKQYCTSVCVVTGQKLSNRDYVSLSYALCYFTMWHAENKRGLVKTMNIT